MYLEKGWRPSRQCDRKNLEIMEPYRCTSFSSLIQIFFNRENSLTVSHSFKDIVLDLKTHGGNKPPSTDGECWKL